MTSDLEKIDLLRARLGVSYKRAKDALDDASGDVVQALIKLEERNLHFGERIQGHGTEVVGQLRHLLHKGQKTRIKIKKEGDTVVEIPATIGALGLLGVLYNTELAIIGAVGAVTAMANNYSLEIAPPSKEDNEENYHYGFYQ